MHVHKIENKVLCKHLPIFFPVRSTDTDYYPIDILTRTIVNKDRKVLFHAMWQFHDTTSRLKPQNKIIKMKQQKHQAAQSSPTPPASVSDIPDPPPDPSRSPFLQKRRG